MSGVESDTYEENGRSYHVWHRGLYWLPHDDAELERLDCLHGMMYNEDKLAMPLTHCQLQAEDLQPLRVLDLGCGTGYWAMDFGDSQPNSEVVGTDIMNVQPQTIPSNVSFKPKCDFNNRHWPFGQDSFDLIRLGMITAATVTWPEMYDNVYRHLRPGYGHIEQIDLDLKPHCEPDLHPESMVMRWYNDLVKASYDGQRPVHIDKDYTVANLKRAGFHDVRHQQIRINWHYYGLPNENYQIGGSFQLLMVQGTGFDAYCMAPFSRVNNWTKRQIDDYLANVKRELALERPKIWSYIHIFTGRKPG